jgi:hypothetical protein
VKLFVIKKEHFYKGLSKESYNKIKLLVKKKKMIIPYYTHLKKFTISKMWNFKTLKIKNMYI